MGSKYMHTIDGKPAFFDGEQICFVRDGACLNEVLVDSLDTIRRQQKASSQYRQSKGWDDSPCSYIRFRDDRKD